MKTLTAMFVATTIACGGQAAQVPTTASTLRGTWAATVPTTSAGPWAGSIYIADDANGIILGSFDLVLAADGRHVAGQLSGLRVGRSFSLSLHPDGFLPFWLDGFLLTPAHFSGTLAGSGFAGAVIEAKAKDGSK
jgi:hypothetical protein